MLQDTIVCKHGSSNVYTNTHSNQAFALYPELKGKGKGKKRRSTSRGRITKREMDLGL